MAQITNVKQEAWLKVLGKGMVTLPKKWRDELGIAEGDIIKAKKEGNTVVIEMSQVKSTPYTVSTNSKKIQSLNDDTLSSSALQGLDLLAAKLRKSKEQVFEELIKEKEEKMKEDEKKKLAAFNAKWHKKIKGLKLPKNMKISTDDIDADFAALADTDYMR